MTGDAVPAPLRRRPGSNRKIGALLVACLLAVAAPVRPVDAAVAANEYLRPHMLVPVAPGRRLNLFCLGHGAPVVVFESGFGATTMAWQQVQDAVAAWTRSCSYDRAGYGFSDPATRPSDARDTVDDLHRLVARAGLPRALVLVGHSMGGLYATLYADTHPGDVAGLVLLDPHAATFERQLRATQSPAAAAAQRRAVDQGMALQRGCLAAARSGELAEPGSRASPCLAIDGVDDPILVAEWDREASGVPYEAANLSEAESTAPRDADTSSLDDDEVPAVAPVAALPPTRILLEHPDHPFPGQSAEAMALMLGLEQGDAAILARRSTDGTWRFVPHSGHDIQHDDPAAVIAAVRAVIDADRRSAASPAPGRRGAP